MFLVPPLLLYGAAVLLPIVQSLVLSLFSWDGITDLAFVGLDNYVKMFTRDDVFWTAFGNALGYLAICLVLQLGGALAVAGLLTALPRARELVKTLYLLPAVISTVAIAFLFVRIYSLEPGGSAHQLLASGRATVSPSGCSRGTVVAAEGYVLALAVIGRRGGGWRAPGGLAGPLADPLSLHPSRLGSPWTSDYLPATPPPLHLIHTHVLPTFGPSIYHTSVRRPRATHVASIPHRLRLRHALLLHVVECLVAVGLIFLLLRRKDA